MSDGSSSSPAKMARAMYDSLGHDLAVRRAESYDGSPRHLAGMEVAARRWGKIRTLRWLIKNSKVCATRNPNSRAVYDALDDLLFEDATQAIGRMGPLEFGAALQGALREEERPRSGGPAAPYWSTRADDLIRSFQRLGPERSGLLLEVIAPPGSGKSNLLTYLGRTAMANGHDVFCNFAISVADLGPTPEVDKIGKFHLARSAKELLPELIQFARRGSPRVGFFLCDEAGGRGMSSGTATTTEARDALLFFQQSRKFRINSFRARQIHNAPKAQQELEVGRIEFRTDGSEREAGRLGEHMPLRVEWTHGAPVGAPEGEITVPDMRRYYDTFQQASFEWNVRMGEMWSYVNRRAEGSSAQLEAIEEFMSALQVKGDAVGCPETSRPVPPRGVATCPKCGHAWIPRVPIPTRCPSCGHRWPVGSSQAPPTVAAPSGMPHVSVSTRAEEIKVDLEPSGEEPDLGGEDIVRGPDVDGETGENPAAAHPE